MSIAVRSASILAALAVLLVASGAAQAQGLVEWMGNNGTLTTFDVDTQDLQFASDPNSEFAIDPNQLELLQNEIIGAGTLYEFVIPNFFDPLPKKIIFIQMTGSNLGAIGAELPYVLDIIGSDSPYPDGGPSVPVLASYIDGTSGSGSVIEAWEMFPNPDWEVVKLFAPTAFELDSIVIATQSIPEPGTVALMAAGLLGLGMAGRRRR